MSVNARIAMTCVVLEPDPKCDLLFVRRSPCKVILQEFSNSNGTRMPSISTEREIRMYDR